MNFFGYFTCPSIRGTLKNLTTPTNYKKLLIQIVNLAHFCENYMIQIKDMFQHEATWDQFSTEEYTVSLQEMYRELMSRFGMVD